MLLAKVKGCAFAADEADQESKVYIKVQDLGAMHRSNFKSETVCGAQSSAGRNDARGIRITHLLFFDESSPTNMREAVYNDATGQYEVRVVDSLPAPISGTLYFSRTGWDQAPGQSIYQLNLDDFKVKALINNHPKMWGPSSLAVDVNGGKMYWHGTDGRLLKFKIQRTNLNGSNIEDIITQDILGSDWGIGSPGLDINRGKIYWCVNHRIYRANLDGSNVKFSLSTALIVSQ